MADYLVLEDCFAPTTDGRTTLLKAGRVISDTDFPVPTLQATGCPLVAYTAGTMAAPVAAFRRQVSLQNRDGDLVSLLLAAGAIGGGGATVLAGDATGPAAANTVVQLQGRPLSAAAPSSGQALVWNGTTWVPSTIPSSVSSVFGRTGSVVAAGGDYAASQVTNDSGVAGANVAAALDTLDAAIPPPAPVTSVFGRTGVVVAAPNDYAVADVTGLTAALATKVEVGGQLGGTISSPDVRGLRTTEGGGTLLTLGSIADGEVPIRSGASIIGTALPSGGATFRGLSGFSASDFYERATGSALDGNAVTGFETIVAVLMPAGGWAGVASGHIVSHRADGDQDGYALQVGTVRPTPGMSDGAGVDFGIFNFQNWQPDQSYRMAFYSVGTDLVNKRFTLNGDVISVGLGTGGYTDAVATPWRMGRSAAGGSAAAFNGIVMGAAFKNTGLFTSAEIQGLIATFLGTGSFGTAIPTHAWSVAGLATGAAPATWTADVGGLDLTLSGSLVVADARAVGPVTTFPIASSSLVLLSGNLIAPGMTSVSAAGPTTIGSTFVNVDATANTVALTTPSFPGFGVECVIADTFGQSAANNITISAAGGQTINGGASIVISTAYEAVRMMFDGSSRWVAGRITP